MCACMCMLDNQGLNPCGDLTTAYARLTRGATSSNDILGPKINDLLGHVDRDIHL